MTFRYATFAAEWWLWTNFDSISQLKFRIDFHLLLNFGTAGLISELLVYSGSDFNTPCSNIRWAVLAQSQGKPRKTRIWGNKLARYSIDLLLQVLIIGWFHLHLLILLTWQFPKGRHPNTFICFFLGFTEWSDGFIYFEILGFHVLLVFEYFKLWKWKRNVEKREL